MEVDILYVVYTLIKEKLTNYTVGTQQLNKEITLPYIYIFERDNFTNKDTISSNKQYNSFISSIVVEVYNKNNIQARETIKQIDKLLHVINITKVSQQLIPNIQDDIVRYRLTYDCIIDTNNKIYRR